MRFLALSGSLRAGASNTAILEAAKIVAAPDVEVELYAGLGDLPAFNPDLDSGEATQLPRSAADLRDRIGRADALLISSPEYAHGIPGSLKNALDWLVGSLEFPGKPVGLLGVAGRAAFARAQLVEVLNTMSAQLVNEACVSIDLPRRDVDARAIAADPDASDALRAAITALAQSTEIVRAD